MKNTAIILVLFTTLLLILTSLFVSVNLGFDWVFYTAIIGQVVWLVTVYKVLTDHYSTNKKFNDWYEDRPLHESDKF